MSKTVVGLALLKAQELGKLTLDDPINKYLPFKINNPALGYFFVPYRRSCPVRAVKDWLELTQQHGFNQNEIV